jgi:AraC-like DNA-binding protein
MQFHPAVSLFAAGKMMDYSPETLVLWEPGATHRYGREDRSWSHSWLHCDGPGIDAVFRASGIPLNRPFEIGNTAIVDEILPAIRAELTGNRRPDPVILEDLVEIMVRRLRRFAPDGEEPSIPPGILAARAYLEQNLAEQLTLERVASVAGLSASHFSAEFRAHIGTPPMRYLLELRLRRAAYLLTDRNASVGEVARAAGFRDPRYFSRQFSKRFGASPREYRRQHQG